MWGHDFVWRSCWRLCRLGSFLFQLEKPITDTRIWQMVFIKAGLNACKFNKLRRFNRSRKRNTGTFFFCAISIFMPVKGVIVIAVWWQKVFVLVQFQNHFRCWLWGQSLSTFSPSCSLSCQPPSGRVRAWFRTDATCTLSTASTPAPHPTAPCSRRARGRCRLAPRVRSERRQHSVKG